jgi:large subunit ribosomal protein L9
MKVILTKTSHLGAIGSVLTVKSGYAKNYLIPRGMVRYATKINIAQLEKEKENLVKEDGIKTVIAERA